jgi:acyl-CoA synthetase (AMP-forming)/AMP-acid ligase II
MSAPSDPDVATFPSLLGAHAARGGDRIALRYLSRGEAVSDEASYAALDAAARTVAGNLLAGGLAGRPVMIALPQGLDFVRCFLGCVYAGAIAIPAPALGGARTKERIGAIAAHARPAVVIAAADAPSHSLDEIRERSPQTRLVAPEDLLSGPAAETLPAQTPDGVAFLQYTSGSTSAPKGVVITHRNILANLEMIRVAFGQTEADSTVSWLPLHHDMGLIGCVLEPLYLGAEAMLMSPLTFLQRPARWLRAMDRFRATTAGAPNFAYDLCARTVTDEQARGIDLSCWRLAFCGSEPIRAATLARFAARFAPSGFPAHALYPCYGLAEATLFVTGGKPASGIRERTLARSGGPGLQAVSCGEPILGAEVALLEPEAPRRTAPGAIGEIAVRGPQVSPGFWDPERGIVPDDTRSVALDGRVFLRTGDLGTIEDGELYVVGRLKNMIIVHGANIYAEDIEHTVKSLPDGAELGAVAALPVLGPERRTESVALVCEVGRGAAPLDPEGLLDRIATAVADAHGVLAAELALVPAGAIERTVSGKLQRARTAERLAGGELPVLARLAPQPRRPA